MVGGREVSLKTPLVAMFVLGLLALPLQGQNLLFHLDFSVPPGGDANDFADVSGNNLAIEVETAEVFSSGGPGAEIYAVSHVPGGGPTLNGAAVDSAAWAGDPLDFFGDDLVDPGIRITGNSTLDAATRGAGSMVAWLKPDDGDTWNNIAKTMLFLRDPNGMFVDKLGNPVAEGVPDDVASVKRWEGAEFQAGAFGSFRRLGTFGAVQGFDQSNRVQGPFATFVNPGTGDLEIPSGDPTDTPTGVWTHLAMTWDATGTATYYVDGVPGTPVSYSQGPPPAQPFGNNPTYDYWTIGGDPQNRFTTFGERLLDGELADFGIFGGQLSQTQIDQIIADGIASLAPSSNADFDGDTLVTGLDFLIWQQNAGGAGNQAMGDANGDGSVDDADLVIWESQYGTSPLQASLASVPEPSTMMLCALATTVFAGTRRRRRAY